MIYAWLVFSWNYQHWLSKLCVTLNLTWKDMVLLDIEYHAVSHLKSYTTKYYFNLSRSNACSLNTLQLVSLGSGALRIATLALQFLPRIWFPAHNSLVGTLWKRYGQDLVKEVSGFKKLDFEYRKALLDLDFVIPCRNSNLISKFLNFKVSNKQLPSSAYYITC